MNLETISQLTLRYKVEGESGLVTSLNNAKAARAGLTVEQDKATRVSESLQKRVDNLQRSLDLQFRSSEKMASVERTLDAARNQGIVSLERQNQLMALASQRHATFASSTRLSVQQMSNMQYQLQDITVSLLSGQSPFTVLMQQGSQIAQSFTAGTGIMGALRAVGGGIVSFLTSPLNLAVLGFALVAGAAAKLYSVITGDRPGIEDTLKRQKDLVNDVADAYGRAAVNAQKVPQSSGSLRFQTGRSIQESRAALNLAGSDLLTGADAPWYEQYLLPSFMRGAGGPLQTSQTVGRAGGRGSYSQMGANPAFGPDIQQAITGLTGGLAQHDILAVSQFRDRLAEIAALHPDDKGILKQIDTLMSRTKDIDEAARSLQEFQQATEMVLTHGFGTRAGRGETDLSGVNPLAEFDKLKRAQQERIKLSREQYAIDLASMQLNRSPSQIGALAGAQEELSNRGDTGMGRDEKALRAQQAQQKATLAAEMAISEAIRGRAQAMRDSVDASQRDFEAVGKGASEVLRLQTYAQLYAQAKKAAADAGVLVTDAEMANIRATADAMARIRMETDRARLKNDNAFENAQLGRSPGDQQIASQLRQIYGDNSNNPLQQADEQLLRMTQHAKAFNEEMKSGWHDITAQILSGAKAADIFKNALSNIASNLMGKVLNGAGDTIINSITGGLKFNGGSGATNWIGSLLGFGTAAGSGPVAGPLGAGGGPVVPAPYSISMPIAPPTQLAIAPPAQLASAAGGLRVGMGVGGSRSWRNNNPGNLEYGAFAAAHGAVGTDGRFAQFPDYASGRAAQEALLFDSSSYRNLTLGQAINRWAPGTENNVPAYIRAMGADPSMRMSQFSTAQRGTLLDNMQSQEGWQVGKLPAEVTKYQQDFTTGLKTVATSTAEAGKAFPDAFTGGLSAIAQAVGGTMPGPLGGIVSYLGSIFGAASSAPSSAPTTMGQSSGSHAPTFKVENYHSSASVSVHEESDGYGGRKPKIVINEMVSSSMASSRGKRTLRNMGLPTALMRA